jgi:hypothetical protein
MLPIVMIGMMKDLVMSIEEDKSKEKIVWQ